MLSCVGPLSEMRRSVLIGCFLGGDFKVNVWVWVFDVGGRSHAVVIRTKSHHLLGQRCSVDSLWCPSILALVLRLRAKWRWSERRERRRREILLELIKCPSPLNSTYSNTLNLTHVWPLIPNLSWAGSECFFIIWRCSCDFPLRFCCFSNKISLSENLWFQATAELLLPVRERTEPLSSSDGRSTTTVRVKRRLTLLLWFSLFTKQLCPRLLLLLSPAVLHFPIVSLLLSSSSPFSRLLLSLCLNLCQEGERKTSRKEKKHPLSIYLLTCLL